MVLDDDRYQRLEAVARRRQLSVATVVREAIDRELGSPAMVRNVAGRRFAAGRRFLAAPPMEVGSVEELREEVDQRRAGRFGGSGQ